MDKSILEVVHEGAKDLHNAGLMNDITMREFDALCLPRIKTYSAKEIKEIRQKCNASQSVFAAFLNTSSSTVKGWEQGAKKPSGASLKLLNLADAGGLDVLSIQAETFLESEKEKQDYLIMIAQNLGMTIIFKPQKKKNKTVAKSTVRQKTNSSPKRDKITA
ncbi:helix-turn-helix domain-containing protein [Zooshikella sp. RANM57]|uniref:helix-turn-helix domain-containing protein n=1 Tax=Zooshikella sp. RANM57 TaxID=3425863 RepID=UPI003D6F86AB